MQQLFTSGVLVLTWYELLTSDVLVSSGIPYTTEVSCYRIDSDSHALPVSTMRTRTRT